MKKEATCPECSACGRIGLPGFDGVEIESWGKSRDKMVLHCIGCDEVFLGRLRLVGRARTWLLDDAGRERAREIRRLALSGDRNPAATVEQRERRREQSHGEVECPDCGKLFVTRRALDAHAAAKHAGSSPS